MSDNVKQTDFGYQVTWADNEFYSSKILIFEKEGSKTSLHFHKNIHKTWFVNAGKFEVQWLNTDDGKPYAQELPEGAVFVVPPLMPVTLKSLAPNSAMAETSNKNDQEDFYRLN